MTTDTIRALCRELEAKEAELRRARQRHHQTLEAAFILIDDLKDSSVDASAVLDFLEGEIGIIELTTVQHAS